MKNFYLFICFFNLLGLIFFSCTPETDPVILVSSENLVSPMKADVHVRFKVEAKSKKSTITRIEIKEYSNDFSYRTLKDTLLNESNPYFLFEYLTPQLSDNQEVKLIFVAYNDKNEKNTVAFSYDYIFEDELLREYSGFSMYTLKSGKPDGFSLDSKQVVYTNEIDYSYVDFYAFQDTDSLLNSDILQHIWKSYTGLSFVKFKGFDYAKATRKSLTESYLSGIGLPTVIDIETDDIILIGFGQTPVGVIKVIGVFDEEGYLNDRYIFNAKFIEEKK